MMVRRIVLEDSEQLPEGYTALEYIQSSGSQRIDTGVKSSASVGMSADFCLVDMRSNQNLAQTYSQPEKYQMTVLQVTNFYGGINFICGYYNTNKVIKEADTNRHIYHFNADGQYTVEMDGIQYEKADPSKTTFPADARNLWLFVRNSPYVDGYAYMKLYSCAMHDGGIKIRDFKPCLDADGVPCLYDLISKTAFYNQGSGSFTWG